MTDRIWHELRDDDLPPWMDVVGAGHCRVTVQITVRSLSNHCQIEWR